MQAFKAKVEKRRAKRAARRDLLKHLQWWTVEALTELKLKVKHKLSVEHSLQQKLSVVSTGVGSHHSQPRLHGDGGLLEDDDDDASIDT